MICYRDLLLTKSNGFGAANDNAGFSNMLQTMRTTTTGGAKTVRALRSLTAAPSGRTSVGQDQFASLQNN
jgi:hypothetical protein